MPGRLPPARGYGSRRAPRATEPELSIGAMGWFAVGTSLLAKAPALHRAGADVLDAAIADGRANPEALGAALASVVGAGRGVVGRLPGSLRDVGRISTLHAAEVVRTLDALVAGLTVTPRGFHAVLELRLELGACLGGAPAVGGARAVLDRIAGEASASSKLGRAARQLLLVERDGPQLWAARAAALEALVAHARRFSADAVSRPSS